MMKKLLLIGALFLVGCSEQEPQDMSDEMEEFVTDTLTNFANGIDKLKQEVKEKNNKDYPYNPTTVGDSVDVKPESYGFNFSHQYSVTVDSKATIKGIHTFAGELIEAKAGETFLILEVTYKNLGKEALNTDENNMLKLKTADGVVYNQSHEIIYHLKDAYDLESQSVSGLNPNSSSTVFVAFEVSEELIQSDKLFLTIPTSKINGKKTEYYDLEIPIN